jgi:exopolysaccharide production protein ExoQ
MSWSPHRPMDLRRAIACATLVVAPLLAFDAFELPGIVTLAMTLPLIILATTYFTTPDNRVPLWELALIALLASSVLWGDDPNYSVERLRTYLPLILATTFASSLVSARTVLRCLELSVAVIIGSSLIYILFDPAGAVRQGSLQLDVTAQFAKNTYGGLLGIALLLTIGHKRRINLLLVVGLVVLLAVNRCVTAWVVLTFLVFATYASRRLTSSMGPRSKPVLAVMGLACVGGAAVLAIVDARAVLAALGKDPTLSTRTEIWAACWQQIKLAPLLGHGAFTFLDTASNSPVTQFVWSQFPGSYKPPHPHNGFLDLIGQLGLVGVAVFAGLMLQGLKRGAHGAIRGLESSHTATLCLIFVLLFGVTEPTYLGSWLVISIMCIAIADARGPVPKPSSSSQSRSPVPASEPAAQPSLTTGAM